ncbi:unnamed protein product [Callosobruchus maculatus]|uniref:Uncharacterized protein n=1 Tax=Callosobruchus maculatus TaxID=64391 RepID=A0A653DDF8_CALMS|nr:unnamed protein product [Callosobruchus maculatus]
MITLSSSRTVRRGSPVRARVGDTNTVETECPVYIQSPTQAPTAHKAAAAPLSKADAVHRAATCPPPCKWLQGH